MRKATFAISVSSLKTFLATLTALAFLLSAHTAHATTYYIDSVNGNDKAVGTSTVTPWKTIAKITSFGKFVPGDTILFKRGGVWREKLNVPTSGTVNLPITFDAYGTGNKPVISGADLVSPSSWQLYKGNIYMAHVPLTTAPSQLYVDGTPIELARWPNTGFQTASETVSDRVTVIDNKLQFTSDQLIGATIYAKDVNWHLVANTIKSFNATTGTIKTVGNLSPYNGIKAGFGYILQNKLWMLDRPGEWFYDVASGIVYLWTKDGKSPATHTVEIPARDNGIVIFQKNFVTIRNLLVKDALTLNVHLNQSSNISLLDLEVLHATDGIRISTNTSNVLIQNNSIHDIGQRGISVLSGKNSNINIVNNTITRSGLFDIQNMNLSVAGIAVLLGNTNVHVENNTVSHIGSNGIIINASNSRATNNIITYACKLFNDCGGLYTNAHNESPTNPAGNLLIENNSVLNTIGNTEGTTDKTTLTRGLYLDDYTHDVTARNNKIVNADYTLQIHNARNNVVTGNKFYGARIANVLLQENMFPDAILVNNTLKDNIFVNNLKDVVTYSILTEYRSNSFAPGVLDQNYFCHPQEPAVMRWLGRTKYNLLAYQNMLGQDKNSIDGGNDCSTSPDTPAPTLVLKSTAKGTSNVVNWTATNASVCVADGLISGAKPATGSETMQVKTSGKATFTCYGSGGKIVKSINLAPVAVSSTTSTSSASSNSSGTTSTQPKPTVVLSANKVTVAKGEAVTLRWVASNATFCSATGGWNGARATAGMMAVANIQSTSSFQISCIGKGGFTSRALTVQVR